MVLLDDIAKQRDTVTIRKYNVITVAAIIGICEVLFLAAAYAAFRMWGAR